MISSLTGTLPSLAQSPTVDRAMMDQTVRAALRTQRQATRSAAAATPGSQQELDLLDREFGLQSISGLVRQEPEQWLLSLETAGFFTSNAALSPTATVSDWVGRPGLRAAWFPKLSEQVSLLAMTHYSLWRYAEQQQLDFDDFGGQFGLQYNHGQGQLPGGMSRFTGWAQYRYNRQNSPWNWGNRFYEAHFLEAGLRQGWAIASSVSTWLGANAAVSVAGGPVDFRRHEYSAQAGALWQITPRLSTTALYRFAWFDHAEVSRTDLNHLLFLGLSCQVTTHFRADLFVSGIFNHSDVNAFDYQALNTGLGLVISHAW
ncbi:MAG: hypothetical protein ACKVY0_20870 [Prosthecobacter sp.]|uniref:hypothetical protein n=1 Tax=Prosthecobacter sp. TaxID=1965333 RepID=UPI0038FF05E2